MPKFHIIKCCVLRVHLRVAKLSSTYSENSFSLSLQRHSSIVEVAVITLDSRLFPSNHISQLAYAAIRPSSTIASYCLPVFNRC